MNGIVVDLTHGGVLISKELKKIGFKEVYAYDIYNTLKKEERKELNEKGIKILKNLEEIEIKEETLITLPVHCPVNLKKLKENPHVKILNFHMISQVILEKWNRERKKEGKILIEITGVKGKTTTLNLLKDIISSENNLLILSSLGAYYYKDNTPQLIEKNISINPTSLIKLIQDNEEDYKYILSESSLGVSSLCDISILTNIIEDYPIAKNTKKASTAKKQVFNSKLIIGEYETLKKYYPKESEKLKNKINTFSLKNKGNTYIKSIEKKNNNITSITISYNNLKTINRNLLNGELTISTFAPGEYNLLNILAATTTALSLEIEESRIKNLNQYKPITGRTSKKQIKKSTIIEEVNPGLNAKSIEKSIEMVENLENYSIILGGEYGITCEEIDENKLSKYIEYKLSNKDIEIILVDELGENIKNKIKQEVQYYNNYNEALKKLIKDEKNILFIYRSNYSNLNKR